MTHPVFIHQIGAVLLPFGDLSPWRRFEGRDVALALLPELPLMEEYPELRTALVLPEVIAAAGGEAVGHRIMGCAIASGECIGERVMNGAALDGVSVPLCWHHDNAQHAGQLPQLKEQIKPALVEAVLAQIASWCAMPIEQLRPSNVCWWAAVHEVIDAMPTSLLRSACRMKPRAAEPVWVGAGYRPSGEHESQFVRPLRGDPIQSVRPMLKKPLVQCVDESPAALHMARPKLPRWECERYLAFVRQLPCVVTGQHGVEAHHLIGHGEGQMGGKAHDLLVMPLCHEAHRQLHADVKTWEREHGSQLVHVLRTIKTALGMGVFG